jgi:LPXTG-motif cell wall-anchored protein
VWSRGVRNRMWSVMIAVAVSLSVGIGGAAAQEVTQPGAASDLQCVDVTVDGPGDLNTRGPTTLGPIAVSLPAGRYRLLMTSTDIHHAPGHQPGQLAERWSVTLDNGYSSPVTPDLATEDISAVFDMGVVELGAASALTFVHHGIAPSPDSVHPSITFRCEPVLTSTTSTTSTTATSTTVATTTTAVPSPSTTTTTEAPPVTRGGDIAPSTTTATPTTVVSTGDNLPRTGGNLSLLWMGLLLLAAGGVFVVVGRLVALEAARVGRG